MAYTEVPVDMVTLNQCVTQASQAHNNIHPIIIKSLISVEGGQVGTNVRNTNGTFDMGVMQINTINLKSINDKFGFSAAELITDPCKNIMVGTWLLWQRIKESPQKLWIAVGNYHSKTPGYRHNYLSKVEKAYTRLLPVMGKAEEAKAIGRTTNWGKAPLLASAATNSHQFPSIKELEALVAQGKGGVASPSGGKAGSQSAKAKPKPEKKTTVIQIKKRNVLRFID